MDPRTITLLKDAFNKTDSMPYFPILLRKYIRSIARPLLRQIYQKTAVEAEIKRALTMLRCIRKIVTTRDANTIKYLFFKYLISQCKISKDEVTDLFADLVLSRSGMIEVHDTPLRIIALQEKSIIFEDDPI